MPAHPLGVRTPALPLMSRHKTNPQLSLDLRRPLVLRRFAQSPPSPGERDTAWAGSRHSAEPPATKHTVPLPESVEPPLRQDQIHP